MFREFFSKEKTVKRERKAIRVTLPFPYSLGETLECGQAFRYEKLTEDGDYKEYMTVVGERIITA